MCESKADYNPRDQNQDGPQECDEGGEQRWSRNGIFYLKFIVIWEPNSMQCDNFSDSESIVIHLHVIRQILLDDTVQSWERSSR